MGWDDVHLEAPNHCSSLGPRELWVKWIYITLYWQPLLLDTSSCTTTDLSGQIPYSIAQLQNLEVLDLSKNKLKGWSNGGRNDPFSWRKIRFLDLHMNNLSGSLPQNFSKGNTLQTLNFNGNQLEGPLPLSLSNCKQLEVWDLEDPIWLEDLQELQVLVLQANKFYGVITSFKAKHPFPKLRIFDISNNYFSGPLPTAYIKKFKGMMNLDDGATGLQYMMINKNYFSYFSAYYDSVVITMKGNRIELERILTTFSTFDLSNHKFEGEIPNSVGQLIALKGLNLSHNRICGSIPKSFGNLVSLEWLDLSSNNLEGEIPMALTNLNFPSVLNLSQNQLQGMIPLGRQFNTFPNYSYSGNPRLCGFPLSRKCRKDEEQPSSPSSFNHEEEFGFGWKPVALGYGCGMVFGVLMGYVVFTTGKL